MKAIILLAVLFTALIFSGCKNESDDASMLVKSWLAYCAAYDVDAYAPTEKQETYFLDCWCGSVEEEEALNELNKINRQ